MKMDTEENKKMIVNGTLALWKTKMKMKTGDLNESKKQMMIKSDWLNLKWANRNFAKNLYRTDARAKPGMQISLWNTGRNNLQ